MQRKRFDQINVIPLIDILLVLLVMVVTGSIAFDGRALGPESAMLVPAGCRRRVLRNLGQAAAVLISRPR